MYNTINDSYLFFILFFKNIVYILYIYIFWIILREKLDYDEYFMFYTYVFKYKDCIVYNEPDDMYQKSLAPFIRNIDWVDIWEYNIKISSLQDHNDLPWNMYYKYKLSMFNTLHVL